MKENYPEGRFTYEDIDEVIAILKANMPDFTEFKELDNGMTLITYGGNGFAMINTEELNKALDDKIKETLKSL